MEKDDWREYKVHVLETLKDIKEILKQQNRDIVQLKVKAAMGGFLGGGIFSAFWMLFEKLHGG